MVIFMGILANYLNLFFILYIYNYIYFYIYLIKTQELILLNFLFRFLGKLVGPFIFNKINFLKNDNK